MNIFFLNRRQLSLIFMYIIIGLIVMGFLMNWKKVERIFFGVKTGVYLEGRDVSGMLPEEISVLVKNIAGKYNCKPINASYFPETGEIIPGKPGRVVKIAETVNRVCLAKAGSRIHLQLGKITPEVSEDYYVPVYHGQKNIPRVALAVNVAWGEEYLTDILSILDSEKVKATFFFVGTWVKAFPELVKTIAESGHEVANHGLYHGHPVQMKRDELKRLISENAILLWSTTGQKPINYFAPPYGEINDLIVRTAAEMGCRTILWSVDTIDWKNPAPELILNRVLAKIEPGGIILMHPTIGTKNVLQRLIHSLRQKNLEPGTVTSVLK